MKSSNKIVTVIFLFALVLRLNFALFTPNWQVADEYPHFYVIKYLSLFGTFPKSQPQFPYYEAYQPPLYYYAAKLIYDIFKNYDFPSPQIFQEFDPDTLTHPPNIALIILRLFSVSLGMLNLFLIYKIALIFFRDDSVIYVLLIASTLPSFVINSSSVTNDSLANLIGTLMILILIKGINIGNARIHYLRNLSLGFALGLALVTKLNLYPFSLIILIGLFLYPITLKEILKNFTFVLIIALVISFWYFYYNILNYGSFIVISPGVEKDYFIQNFSLNKIIYGFRNLFWSFWAAAGRIYQIHLPAYLYILVFFPITLVSLIGNLKYIFVKNSLFDERIYYFYLFLFSTLIFIGSALYFHFISINHSAWGRYMFPNIAPFLILFVFGVKNIFNENLYRYLMLILFIIQVCVCLYLFLEVVKY